MDGGSAAGLTGVWSGIFSYPRLYAPVQFTATLIETAGHVTGTVHEPCTVGDCPSDTLYAAVTGRREGSHVTFLKTYERVGFRYRKPVHYDGVLSADRLEIEGRWSIGGSWSGRFIMVRSAGPAAKVERKARERA